jgi:hypothetical protein
VLLFVAQLLLVSVTLVCAWSAVRSSERANEHQIHVSRAIAKLVEERARVTTLEREVDSLRRELRSLSGKFHAARREYPTFDAAPVQPVAVMNDQLPVCQNWLDAKLQGPSSPAASCECDYCTGAREARRTFRQSVVPKSAQGAAELAKLNAGKP